MGIIESIRGVMWARRNQPDDVAYVLGASHERFHPAELVRQTVLAEEAGFDGVAASDHISALVAGRHGPRVLRQRMGVARGRRSGDQPHRRRHGCHGVGAPLQPGRRRSADRHGRGVVPRPRLPGRRLERGHERGAGGHGLARHRRAARPHRGGPDDHRAPAGRRDGGLRGRVLHDARCAALPAPRAAPAHLPVGVPRAGRRSGRPSGRRRLDPGRPQGRAQGDRRLPPRRRGGRARAGRDHPAEPRVGGRVRRRRARGEPRVEGDPAGRAVHGRHPRAGRHREPGRRCLGPPVHDRQPGARPTPTRTCASCA